MLVQVRSIKVKDNFRQVFEGIDDLAENIEECGLLQPIVITADNVLVAGERRLKAVRKLKWQEVECVIKDYTDDVTRKAHSIFENVKRQSLKPSEENRALAWLRAHWIKEGLVNPGKGGPGAEEKEGPNFYRTVAEQTGQSIASVREKTRVGERMNANVAKALDSGEIMKKDALDICQEKDKKKQNKLLKEVKEKRKAMVTVNGEMTESAGQQLFKDICSSGEKLLKNLKQLDEYNLKFDDRSEERIDELIGDIKEIIKHLYEE